MEEKASRTPFRFADFEHQSESAGVCFLRQRFFYLLTASKMAKVELRWCETKPSRWHSLSGSLVGGSRFVPLNASTEALQCSKCRLILVQPDAEGCRS
jgi:hypothetical protein